MLQNSWKNRKRWTKKFQILENLKQNFIRWKRNTKTKSESGTIKSTYLCKRTIDKIYGQKMEEYKEAEMNYTLLKDLSDTANGEQKGKTKISFERFVQSVYFDLILAAANERLSVMSEQRYYLLRKEENDINKGSSGLELRFSMNGQEKKKCKIIIWRRII